MFVRENLGQGVQDILDTQAEFGLGTDHVCRRDQGRFNRRLQLLGYLVSRFKRSRAYQQSYLAQLRSHFGPKTFEAVIPDLAQFERSVTDAVLLTEHAPSSPAARIAREFFDETLRGSLGRSDGTSSSGKA